MNSTKSPLDSKGILGGLLSGIGFTWLAALLSKKLGIDIAKDELSAALENVNFLATQAGIWVGLLGAVVGLVGNWFRKAKVSFTGGGQRPWKSRGLWGNLVAAAGALAVFVQSASLDAEQVEALVGDVTKNWEIVAPAVMALLGALQGFWGRLRATRQVDKKSGFSVGAALSLLPGLMLVSCAPALATEFADMPPWLSRLSVLVCILGAWTLLGFVLWRCEWFNRWFEKTVQNWPLVWVLMAALAVHGPLVLLWCILRDFLAAAAAVVHGLDFSHVMAERGRRQPAGGNASRGAGRPVGGGGLFPKPRSFEDQVMDALEARGLTIPLAAAPNGEATETILSNPIPEKSFVEDRETIIAGLVKVIGYLQNKYPSLMLHAIQATRCTGANGDGPAHYHLAVCWSF